LKDLLVDTVFGCFGSLNMRRKDTAEVCPAHTMKEVSGQLHVPVTLHLPHPQGKEPPSPIIHWLGGWVGLRASMAFWKEKNLLPLVGIEAWIIQP